MTRFTDEDLDIMREALIDAECINKEAMNLWQGRGREKWYRDRMIEIQEVIKKLMKIKKERKNQYEEDFSE